MTKQANQGKKRRSENKNLLSMAKAFKVYEEGMLVLCLPVLFDAIEKKAVTLKDRSLEKDIRIVMDCILRIETRERTKRKKQDYKSLSQDEIEKLDKILRKQQYKVSVDFAPYSKLIGHINVKGLDDKWSAAKKLKTLIDNKISVKALPGLRFYPIGFVGDVNKEGDEKAREYLRLGLFDYLQRIILGLPERPKKCKWCKEWFISVRKNTKTCSSACKEKNWVKNEGGQTKRRRNTKNHRKRIVEDTTSNKKKK